jgi:hypothetical protein
LRVDRGEVRKSSFQVVGASCLNSTKPFTVRNSSRPTCSPAVAADCDTIPVMHVFQSTLLRAWRSSTACPRRPVHVRLARRQTWRSAAEAHTHRGQDGNRNRRSKSTVETTVAHPVQSSVDSATQPDARSALATTAWPPPSRQSNRLSNTAASPSGTSRRRRPHAPRSRKRHFVDRLPVTWLYLKPQLPKYIGLLADGIPNTCRPNAVWF